MRRYLTILVVWYFIVGYVPAPFDAGNLTLAYFKRPASVATSVARARIRIMSLSKTVSP